jgi:predicted SAM-dependent methyltransferase
MSETAAARSVLAPYCVGMGLDIGFGGTAISPTAICFDMEQMYCPSLEGHRQHLRGDARHLPFICDNAFDYIYSSHLLEDFTYEQLIGVLLEWRRILAPSGVLVINCPDQQRFLAHCGRTGQSINANHKEQDFSFRHFVDRCLVLAGRWDIVFHDADVPPYSWYGVFRKVAG